MSESAPRINWLVLQASVQRALLFNIRPSVVCISIDLSGANELLMRVQFDNEPNSDDMDMYYAVAGEVMGDFVEMHDTKVSFITSAPIWDDEKENHLRFLIFARSGPNGC